MYHARKSSSCQPSKVVADSVMHADVATTALFGLDEATIAGTLARRLPGAELARVI